MRSNDVSRGLYGLAAFVAAVLLVFAVRDIVTAPADAGWDLHATCVGLAAIRQGADPYVAGHGPFYYPYLFHVAWMSAPLCLLSPEGSMAYAWIYMTLMIGSVAVLTRAVGAGWPDALLLGIAAPVLLDAAHWMTLTGNVAVLEVPLAAAAVLTFHQRRLALSGVAYGMMASFKLLPVAGLLAFPLVLAGRERPARPFFAGVVTFALIVLANLAVMGGTRSHYFTQLVGVIPGQHSASIEAAGAPNDPNIVEFSLELSRAMGLTRQDVPVTAIAVLFLLLGASLTALRQSAGDDSLWKTRLFCASIVVINLALFRLKPYTFVTLVPFLLVCCLRAGPRANSLLLTVALLAAPFAARLPLPRIARELHVPAAYTAHVPAVGRLIQEYSQLCGLLILLGAILIALHLELRSTARLAGPR